MHLAHLVNMIGFLINFTWVLFLSIILLTIKTVFVYLRKLFDLPVDVILAMREIKAQNENKNKKVQRPDSD
jgi:Zn-dependent membrane protease YugP